MSISELLRIAEHLPAPERDLVQKAYERALEAHAGQRRLSGEDYVEHPLQVATVLADLHLDAPTLAAALLHDTVEDTDLTLQQVSTEFGADVAHLLEEGGWRYQDAGPAHSAAPPRATNRTSTTREANENRGRRRGGRHRRGRGKAGSVKSNL